jgi:anti-sigma B factor antagonist
LARTPHIGTGFFILRNGVGTVILHLIKGQLKGVTVLDMKGSIHAGPDCRRLEQEIESLISTKENRIILDLTQVTHVDSSAIGSIVRCLTKLKTCNGMLRVAGATGMIEHCFKLTQLHKVVELYPTVAAAVENLPPDCP